MQLAITYINGSRRIINPSASFFETDHLFDRRTQTNIVMTPTAKALSLALSLGQRPYTTVLTREGQVLLNNIDRGNKPHVPKQEEVPDETLVRKKLRNQFKNVKFTDKWILGKDKHIVLAGA